MINFKKAPYFGTELENLTIHSDGEKKSLLSDKKEANLMASFLSDNNENLYSFKKKFNNYLSGFKYSTKVTSCISISIGSLMVKEK